jgi:hypothetical protein
LVTIALPRLQTHVDLPDTNPYDPPVFKRRAVVFHTDPAILPGRRFVLVSSLTTELGTERIEAVSVAGGNGRWSSSTRTSGDIFVMSVSGKFEPKALLATPAFD